MGGGESVSDSVSVGAAPVSTHVGADGYMWLRMLGLVREFFSLIETDGVFGAGGLDLFFNCWLVGKRLNPACIASLFRPSNTITGRYGAD